MFNYQSNGLGDFPQNQNKQGFGSKMLQKSILATAVATALVSGQAMAGEKAEPESFFDALKMGSTKLHFRLRYENVDQDGLDDASTAQTLKTRLTYTSADFSGFGLSLEMDDTTEVLEVDYNDGNNGMTDKPAIVDPEGTEVNQAFLSYKNGGTTVKYGRQRILLDNQRFVGGVGWRQDEQTYSGLTINSKPTEELSLFFGYITQVNRIFAEAKDHNHETSLANISYTTPYGKAIAYGYMIENKEQAFLGWSSDTVGVRWQGKAGENISYNLEYASQSDAGENPTEYEASYTLAEVVGTIPVGDSKLKLTIGNEVLGSDDGTTAFKTTLATLHKFQGWADKFLGTPNGGIVDNYFSVGGKFGKIKTSLAYHTLSSDVGSMDYGTEIDAVVGTKVGPVGLTLKYANYSADDYLTDTSKLWLMASAKF